MADQKGNQEKGNQGGFPQNQTTGQDTHSTTGDGHPPRPGERQTQENMAGQGTGQMGGAQQDQQQNRGSQQNQGRSQQDQGQGAAAGGSSQTGGGSQKGSGSGQSGSGSGQSGSGNS